MSETPPADIDVTILITTHNRPDDLRKTVANLLPLAGGRTEIVIVDDKSTDPNQLALLDELEARANPRLRVERLQENLNCVLARKKAVFDYGSRYIIIVDDDAYFRDANPAILDLIVDRFEKEPRLAVQTMIDYVPGAGIDLEKWKARFPDGSLSKDFCNTACAIRKAAFVDVGGFRNEMYLGYGEEQDLSIRLLDKEWYIRFYHEPLVIHDKTTVSRSNERMYRGTTLNRLRFLWWYHPVWFAALQTFISLKNIHAVARKNTSVGGFWAGLNDFIREIPEVAKARKPLRKATFKKYYTMRRHRIMDLDTLERMAGRSWPTVLTR